MAGTPEMEFMVVLSVACDTQEAALRVVEMLSRPMVGLSLDNLQANLSVTPMEKDADDAQRP